MKYDEYKQKSLLRTILRNAWDKMDCFCVESYSIADLDEAVDYLTKRGIIALPVRVGDTVYKRESTVCRFGELPKSIGCAENKTISCEDWCDANEKIVEVTVPDLAFIAENFLCRRDTSQYFLTRDEACNCSRKEVSNNDEL